MDFFTEAVNKAKGAFDVAYKKAGDVASLQKQKLDVAAMESKLTKAYEALGRAAIEVLENSSDVSDNVKNLVSDIREREAEITAAKNEILKSQGKKFCANCGASNLHEAHFCYACGESFIKNTAENE